MFSVASRAAMRRLGLNVAAVPVRTLVIRSSASTSPLQAPRLIQGVRQFASAKTTTKAATTKAATAKKTTAAKTTKAKKPVAKKKTATTKAKAKAKPKPKPKPKTKVAKKAPKKVNPEVQLVKERRELKKTALFSEPKGVPDTAWRAYVAEALQGHKHAESGAVTDKMKSVAQAFKNLSSTERQQFDRIAEENARTNAATYKAWVESYSIDEINAANNARFRLKRVHNYPKGYVKTIKDERAPKHPVSSFGFFTKARYASGEMNTEGPSAVSGNARAIGAAWRAMSAAERQPFEDLARAESARYEKEFEAAFGRKPEVSKRSPTPA